MTYPASQTINVRDGGIGLPSSGAIYPLVVGTCSGGTANTLYFSTNPNSLSDLLGQGPGVELGLPMINARGGVLLLKPAASTAGAAGAVTKVAQSTSTGTITVAGAPYDAYQFKARIKSTGALGVARFDFSLDALGASPSFSDEITVPSGGTYAIPNTNLTLTFVPGGGPILFENGDTHSFACTAPQYTTADLATAIAALLQALGSYIIEDVYFTGRSASAAAGATMAAAIATHMSSLEARRRWARAMMDVGADTSANVITSFGSFAANRVAVAYGQADIVSLNPNAPQGWSVPRQSAAFALSERAAGADLSENLGRTSSGLLRVSAILNDEGSNQQFIESHKINTLRTYDGENGFFSTNGYLKSGSGSDFLYWDWGRVIDRLCRVVYSAQQRWMLRKVRTLLDGTGAIDPRDARRIETMVRTDLKDEILDAITVEGFASHVSGLEYVVDLTANALKTRNLKSTLRAIPLPPIEGFTTDIGFTTSLAA